MTFPSVPESSSYLPSVPGIAMLDGGGIDSTLEYILSDVCEFLLLHPFVPDA
jgi:hypothetical protein